MSRYETNVGMEAFDLHMIAKGFKIFKPTPGQKVKYSTQCVDYIRENYVVITEDSIVDVRMNTEMVINFGIDPLTTFIVVDNYDRRKRQMIIGMCDKLEKQKYIKYVSVPDTYAQFGVAVNVLRDIPKKLIDKRYKFRTIGKNYIMSASKDEYNTVAVDYEIYKCWYSDTKYYTRYYSAVGNLQTTALVVGLDFNPYSPYSLDVLEEVEILEGGVKYRRRYKEDGIEGFFDFTRKRYHSDVWYPAFFSSPYSRDLMSCDFVVNHYRVEKKLGFKGRFHMLGAPLLIDAYGISKKIKIGQEARSCLRYRDVTVLDKKYVPYMTTAISVSSNPIVDVEVVEWNRPITIEYKNGLFDTYYVKPAKNDKSIEDFFRWHKNIRKSVADIDDYEFVMDQYRSYFILEYNSNVFSGKGETVSRRGDINRFQKQTGVTIKKYKVWKVKGPKDRGKVFKMFRVPYCIRRYPHNVEGSLISDLFHMTLEEAVKDVNLIKEIVKDPPWIFKNECEGLEELKFEFYEDD